MASYLRPRRGKKSTAIAQNILLKRGEVFFEAPDTGVGTGAGNIKIGDGTTPYVNLPYFIESGKGGGGNSNIVDLSSSQYNALSQSERNNGSIYSVEVGNDIQLAAKNIPFNNAGTRLSAINVQTAINEMENELPKFIYDEDGKIVGYKTKVGADSVFPFKGGGGSTGLGQLIYSALPNPGLYSATGNSTTGTTLTCPRSGAVTIYYYACNNKGEAVSNVTGLKGLVTKGTDGCYEMVKTTVAAGEELTLKATVGAYAWATVFFFMIYDDTNFDKEIYFSSIGYKGYSTTENVSCSSTLTAPETGDVVIYYFSFSRSNNNVFAAKGNGIKGLVNSGSKCLSSIETHVTKGEIIDLALTVGSYHSPTCGFFMIYK